MWVLPVSRLLSAGLALLAALVAVCTADAQVGITPSIVYLRDAQRISDFEVSNHSEVAQEVTIDFRFGYMRSDSIGNLAMEYDDTAAAARYSMADWARAFPRRFLLPPGGEQLVRITVRPRADLPEGAYWTRLVTTSTPQSPLVDSIAPNVSTHIVLKLEQVSTVIYRKGAAEAGIALGALSLNSDSAGLNLLVPMVAAGASPFLGNVEVRVRDTAGTLVHEARTPLAIYFQQVHRAQLPAALPRGDYTAEVSVRPGREDLPFGSWSPAPPATATLQFRAP